MIKVWDSVNFPIPRFSDPKVIARRLALWVAFVSNRNGMVLAGGQSQGGCSPFPFSQHYEDLMLRAGLCFCGFPSLVGLEQPARCLDPSFLNAPSVLSVLKYKKITTKCNDKKASLETWAQKTLRLWMRHRDHSCPQLWPQSSAGQRACSVSPQHNLLQEDFNHQKKQWFRSPSALPKHKILNFVLWWSPCRCKNAAGWRCSGF